MASLPFTLAALATSAVPNLAVFGVREHGEDPSFASAVVVTEDAELLVRVPRTQAAEVLQSAEVLGLAALSTGSRSCLPFAVPESLGMTRAGDTRAVVTTHVDGDRFEAAELADDSILLLPIAEAVAAIHELPQSIALHGGLPVRTAQDLRLIATRLIDRADATRLLPETVLRRWQRAVEAAELWEFAPTTVHGSLDAEQLRIADDQITGIVGWSEFSVGDPAADLAWVLAAGNEVLDGVLARYSKLRNAGSLNLLRARAALYHELEVARWLLHGTEAHDQAVIDDAVAMLDRMVGAGGTLSIATEFALGRAPLNEQEVEDLLLGTPTVNDHLSDTAAYEALDEDRMFGFETDFIEPIDEGGSSAGEKENAARQESTASGNMGAAGGQSAAAAALGVHEQLTEPIDSTDLPQRDSSRFAALPESEQLTEPIDPEDLPTPRPGR